MSSPSRTNKSDITFHPSSLQIARRCKQANKNASKQLSLDMEKLALEQQKARQRFEKEQDLLCQELLEAEISTQDRRKLSETSKPHYAKRVERSKTTDLLQAYSPLRLATKGRCFTFDEVSQIVKKTPSLKTPETDNVSPASLSPFCSTSVVSEPPSRMGQGRDRGGRRMSNDESQPDWQVALAARRKQKLSQLQMFRELGHWGEDRCQKATAMLTGCPFNPVSPSSTALSHTDRVSTNEGDNVL